MRKSKLSGFLLLVGISYLMTSCLGSEKTETEEWLYGNAQIASFSISNELMGDMSVVKFTIDQLNGKIFNKDSMPYGTVFEDKVLFNISLDSQYPMSGIQMIEQATGDTVRSISDSVNFTEPVMITVYAYDGRSSKTYEAKLNIHQVNPDTIVWNRSDLIDGKTFQDMKAVSYNNAYYLFVKESGVYQLYRLDVSDMNNQEKLPLSDFPDKAILSQITVFENELYVITEAGVLYASADGQVWSPVEGGKSIRAILGYLPESTISGRSAVLCCVIEEGETFYFGTIDKTLTYTRGRELPENFPIINFGQFNYVTMYYPRLTLSSGRDSKNRLTNTTWATMDGLTWAALSNPQMTFSNREGVAFTYYDNCFFVVGGFDESGQALHDIWFSKDQGINWLSSKTVRVYLGDNDEDGTEEYVDEEHPIYPLPEEYVARGFSSVVVDKDNYMLLFGGKADKNTNVLNELWRGRINRLGFGKN